MCLSTDVSLQTERGKNFVDSNVRRSKGVERLTEDVCRFPGTSSGEIATPLGDGDRL